MRLVKEKKYKHFRKGFTLLEMAIVMGILGLLMILISDLLSQNFVSLRMESFVIENRDDARKAVEFIVEELVSVRDSDNDIELVLSGSSIIYAEPYRNHYIIDVRTGGDANKNADIWLDKPFDEFPGILRRGQKSAAEGNIIARNILRIDLKRGTQEIDIGGGEVVTHAGIFIEAEVGARENDVNKAISQRFLANKR